MRVAAIVCAYLLTAACAPEPAPTPAPALPELVRPQIALTPPAQGNVWIPRARTVVRSGVPGVFVYEHGRARFRMVRLGRSEGARVEVIAGLIGDEVLIGGDLGAVRDGSPIRDGG